MKQLRVLLCDDHAILRTGIRLILEQTAGFEVVGEAACAEQLLEMASMLQPDVVILDISMPGRSGLDVLDDLRAQAPRARVLVLSVHDQESFVLRALDRGAHGYLLKGTSAETLRAALQLLAHGGMPIDQALHGALGGRDLHRRASVSSPVLSPREQDVLRRIAAGYTNREIAVALGLSLRTVERQRSNLAGKLGLHKRTELVGYALRTRLQVDSSV